MKTLLIIFITFITFITITAFAQSKKVEPIKPNLDSVKLNSYNIELINFYQKKVDSIAKPFNEKINILITTKLAEKVDPKRAQYIVRNGHIVFVKPD